MVAALDPTPARRAAPRAPIVAILVALTLVGCSGVVSSPPPTAGREGSAALELKATWARCHQMGACVYSLALTTPEGVRSVALERANSTGDTGPLTPGAGFPARLAGGSYDVTLVSTMLGDTIEPNGSITVLGEEASCTATFDVGPQTSVVQLIAAFTPGRCTVEAREDPG